MVAQLFHLKEIADIKSGKRLPAGHDFVDIVTPHSYVRARDIKKGKISSESLAYISEETHSKIKRYIIEKGDVAITIVANIGDVGYCEDNCNGANLTENAARLTNFKKELVDSKYLAKLLGLPHMKQYMESLAVGAAQAKLGIYKIEKIKVQLPSLPIQQKIATILSTYDNLIENNTKRIKLLEQMAENLYKEWFVRFRFPGHENVEMENGLPKGWKTYSLKELCTINGKTISSKRKNEIIHYLDTSSITDNSIIGFEDYILEEAPSRAKRIVKNNSIIFSTVRPNLRHMGIMKQPIENTIVSTGFAVFDCKYDIANIIYRFLSSQEIVDYCQSIAEGAVATYPSIRPEEIGSIKIALPKMEIAQEIDAKFEQLIKEQNALSVQNEYLTKQRDLLLPRLMSGKLEVKE